MLEQIAVSIVSAIVFNSRSKCQWWLTFVKTLQDPLNICCSEPLPTQNEADDDSFLMQMWRFVELGCNIVYNLYQKLEVTIVYVP